MKRRGTGERAGHCRPTGRRGSGAARSELARSIIEVLSSGYRLGDGGGLAAIEMVSVDKMQTDQPAIGAP